MMLIKPLLVFAALTVQNYECARIFTIFPVASPSHYILGHALMSELAARGHEVTMISPYKSKNPSKNYHEVILENAEEVKTKNLDPLIYRNLSMYESIVGILPRLKAIIRSPFDSKNFQEFVKRDQKFDLYIHFLFADEAYLGLAEKFNASTIGFSVVGINPWIDFMTGNPKALSFVPSTMTVFGDKITFWQRLNNLGASCFLYAVQHWINLPYQRQLFAEQFPTSTQTLDELIDNVDVVLSNSHFTTLSPRPFLPNIIQIGGYHLEEKEPLSDALQKYLDESKDGVILVTFGSNLKIDALPPTLLEAMIQSFNKTTHRVLWKYDGPPIPNLSKNVRLEGWLPQRSVLAHKNTKLFITHAGFGGITEAVYHSVPMICVPFFGDQPKNALDSVENGYAIQLLPDTTDERALTDAINEILTNATYRENMRLKSDLFKNTEISGMDRAVFWVEHVIRHKGAKHLKSAVNSLYLYEYLMLDVYGFIAAVLLALIMIVKKMFKCCFARRNAKRTKNGKNMKSKKQN